MKTYHIFGKPWVYKKSDNPWIKPWKIFYWPISLAIVINSKGEGSVHFYNGIWEMFRHKVQLQVLRYQISIEIPYGWWMWKEGLFKTRITITPLWPYKMFS